MNRKRIDAYQHVRNKECIYRRVGDTDVFTWNNCKRTELGIKREMRYNDKFIPYAGK